LVFVLILFLFSSTHSASTHLYTLSLHDALPIYTEAVNEKPSEQGTGGSNDALYCKWKLCRLWPLHGNLPGGLYHDGRRCGQGHRSEEHTSELQSRFDLVCRLLLEKKNIQYLK